MRSLLRGLLVGPLTLVACHVEKSATEESGLGAADSAPVETAGDSDATPLDTTPVDTSPQHSAESADETAETAGESAGSGATGETADTGTAEPRTAADCFASIWGDSPAVDYDQFNPVINSTCTGTNHQDIHDVQRVVFIGDSITVGTPPTAADEWYRNRLAASLAAEFGLEEPAWEWENVDLVNGTTYVMESGAFASCAKWGARTDDILQKPHEQLEACIPEEDRELPTLIVMTVGGNDIYSLLEDEKAGVDEATMRATYLDAMALLRDAAEWVADPTRFPNGGWLIFGNTYDFTDEDGALEMAECPGAQLIGMDAPLLDPVIQSIFAEGEEEMMSIAVDTRTDLVFMGESFCGHGYNAADSSSRCYRGPDAELWFDLTCEHPDGAGHEALATLFQAVVDE